MARYTSQRAIQRQRKNFWKKTILFFVLSLLLLFLLSWMLKLEKVKIQNINIIGNSIIEDGKVTEIINENISGKYFWLFSKNNILIYPKVKIEKELLDSFVQIKEVAIKFGDFQSIIVEIIERKPYAIWCDGLMDEKCYFMDSFAYLYDKAPSFSNNVYFKYLGDLQNISTSTPVHKILRQIYLMEAEDGQFERVNLFIRFLKDININSYKLMIRENNDYELFFNNESKLIFDGYQDFGEIFENLQVTLIELGDLGEREFEYIDLRFDRKVLYKFRGN